MRRGRKIATNIQEDFMQDLLDAIEVRRKLQLFGFNFNFVFSIDFNFNFKTIMKKTPWPTKAVMQQIYEQQLWGGNAFDYYSGEGSHKSEIIHPYIV